MDWPNAVALPLIGENSLMSELRWIGGSTEDGGGFRSVQVVGVELEAFSDNHSH